VLDEDEVPSVEVFAHSDNWDHMTGWGGGWMWLWGLAMVVLLIAFIAWLVPSASASSRSVTPAPRDPADRAREILGERFAKGELSAEEYRERLNELQ